MGKTQKKRADAKQEDPFKWLKRVRMPHSEDVVRIRQVLENLGYSVTLQQCYQLWAAYSKTQEDQPVWLVLPMTYSGLRSKLVYNVIPDMSGVKIDI